MPLLGHIKEFSDNIITLIHYICGNAVFMRGHDVLSLKQLAGNLCKAPENVLYPAVVMSPVSRSTYVGTVRTFAIGMTSCASLIKGCFRS